MSELNIKDVLKECDEIRALARDDGRDDYDELARRIKEAVEAWLAVDVEGLLNRLAVTLGGLGAYRDELALGQQRESVRDAIDALQSLSVQKGELEREIERRCEASSDFLAAMDDNSVYEGDSVMTEEGIAALNEFRRVHDALAATQEAKP